MTMDKIDSESVRESSGSSSETAKPPLAPGA
jgi:hypothetical protein